MKTESRRPIWPEPIDPLERQRISEPIGTGIRAIDALMTVGRGQRISILSGPGVGKSVLMGMISRYTSADVTVIALVGERGREVRDFIERDLGTEGMRKAVVVVATGDEPPLVRVQAGAVATAIAEYFRDQGGHVLLLMDSLTRLAMAQRQIGLVAGEPPTTKGYTPSVFNLLPELLERSGRIGSGSITGFYTVLVEGDDMTEPIADAVRSITDGHLWLSRALANRGHYPAIDILESVSRVMIDVTDGAHLAAAREIQRSMATYRDIEDLVNLGAYSPGSNPEADQAIKAHPLVDEFLRQTIGQGCRFSEARASLLHLAERTRRLVPHRQ
jgi:flagellum-specific ATP synthase